ncbi:MAG: methyltransferase, TIGR04325 family, partial [Nitrospina sp.]|nr:methyltransferase, TIGR04325 family [Nitrospina sp.]
GGGTGLIYFQIQSFLSNKNNIIWNIVDNDLLRDLGIKYVKNLNLKIKFRKKIPNDKKFDIFYSNTSLQYLPDFKIPFEELLVMPQYIVLTRLLVTNSEKVIMKQNVFGFYTPCVFHNLSELISYFEGNGYTIIYNLPNFEETTFHSNLLPKDFLSKYRNFSRDLILKKID